MASRMPGKRRQHLRKTKAQLIDELEKLEFEIARAAPLQDASEISGTFSQSQNLFRVIVDNLPMGIALKDKQGKFVLVNKQLQEWFGLSETDVLGKTNDEVSWNSKAEARIRKKQEKEVWKKQTVMTRTVEEKPRLDGSVRTFEVTKFPVLGKDGKMDLICSIIRNLSKEVQSERALRDSENRLLIFINNIQSLVSLKDIDGRYILVNDEYIKQFGAPKDIKGKRACDILPPSVGRPSALHEREVIKTKSQITQERVLHHLANPTIHLTTKFPILNAEGEVTAIGSIGTDITERKQAEKLLEESEAALKIRVSELVEGEVLLKTQGSELSALAEESARMRDEMEILNKQKDKFFSIIAHDLRNPFHSLLGYSEILATRAEILDEEQVARYGGMVYRASERAFALVEDLLDWSRLQMGRMDFDLQPLDLGEVIEENLLLLEPSAATKKIQLTAGLTPGLTVSADKHMLNTIIRNLITNAIKFTDESGEVSVVGRQLKGKIEIAISDSGIGMAPEKMERLFRIEENTSTKGTKGEEGTGLGLHLCKELVEKHGGEITVESVPNKGSTFRFTLNSVA